jgi:hypothetical protein
MKMAAGQQRKNQPLKANQEPISNRKKGQSNGESPNEPVSTGEVCWNSTNSNWYVAILTISSSGVSALTPSACQ